MSVFNKRMLGMLSIAALLTSAGPGFSEEKAKPEVKAMVGKFSKLQGTVEVQKFGTQKWVTATEGMAIGSGDQVAAGIDGKAQIIFANSKTDVEPLAQFSVGRNFETKENYSTEIFLKVGKLVADVDKKSGKTNKFTVTTPSSVAGIRGTVLEAAYTPGVGAVNTISEGAGYVMPVQPDKLPPAIQQILNIPPPVEAREAAAKAAEKAGAPAEVVAQIAAGVPPTEEARAVMAQIAVAGGASAGAAAAIEQGFASFAAFAPSLTIPEGPVAGADVAPIAAGGAPEAAAAPGGEPAPGAAPEPGAAPGGIEAPAATGMEAFVALGGGAPGGGPGGPAGMEGFGGFIGFTPAGGPAEGGAPGGGEPANPMQAMADLLATVGLGGDRPGAPAPEGPGGPGGPGPVGEPGAPGGPGGPGEPGAPTGDPGVGGPPIGEGVPGGGPGEGPVGEPLIGGPGEPVGGPIDNPFGPIGGPGENPFGPVFELGNGDRGILPENREPGGPAPGPIIEGRDVVGPGGGGLPFAPVPLVVPGGDLSKAPDVDPNQLHGNLPDRDFDGLPNEWEEANGLNPDDPSDKNLDADGDGYPNIVEYVSQTNPQDGASQPTASKIAERIASGLAGAAAFVMNERLDLDASLGPNFFAAATYAPSHDRDGDGIPNDQEVLYGLNPDDRSDAGLDLDGDGFPNIVEFQLGVAPNNASDVPDRTELSSLTAAGPLPPAMDYMINNFLNLDATLGPNFFNVTSYAPSFDVDGDGMPNDWEVANGLNPNSRDDADDDGDGDGFPNIVEYQVGTNPASGVSVPSATMVSTLLAATALTPTADYMLNEFFNLDATLGADFFTVTSYNPDFDGDGMYNQWEIDNGLDPNNATDASSDLDGDGYTNLDEFQGHSDPANNALVPFSEITFSDDDGDGLPNEWELSHGLNPGYPFDASGDLDGDGFTNMDEFFSASDPLSAASTPGSNPDVDGDLLPNSWELAWGFNPNSADGSLDADGDGYTNLQEFQMGTDPRNPSSNPGAGGGTTGADDDFDGMPDNWEVANGFNPMSSSDASADADADGYTNLQEFQMGTDPRNSASNPGGGTTSSDGDDDGMPDNWEIANGFNPGSATDASSDADGDGYSNLMEFQNGTNPRSSTSVPSGSSPDGDADGMPDNWEVANGFNPGSATDATADADGDGYSNLLEFQNGTDPRNTASNPGTTTTVADADHDEMPDNWEIANGFNPNSALDAAGDADGDGYKNVSEFIDGSNPQSAASKPNRPFQDQDMDGMPDAWELRFGLNPTSNDAAGDADGDLYSNLDEFTGGSNPKQPTGPGAAPNGADDDMDGIPNSWEVVFGLNPASAVDASTDDDGDGFTNLEEFLKKSDPHNKFVVPPYSHGIVQLPGVRDNTWGVMYDEHTDGFRRYFAPDRANVAGSPDFQHPSLAHPREGLGYINEGGTVPAGYTGAGSTISDGDNDGHSPQAAFMGTAFHDPDDGNFGSPSPQHPFAQPHDIGAGEYPSSWANNPNPFHH